MTTPTPTIVTSEPKMTLTIEVERTDGNDLDLGTAHFAADMRLCHEQGIGRCPGDWHRTDTERVNYDKMRVIFTEQEAPA